LHLMCILFLHMNVFTTCYFHSLGSWRRFWVHSSLSGYFHKFNCLYYFGKWSQGIADGVYVWWCSAGCSSKVFSNWKCIKMMFFFFFFVDLFFIFDNNTSKLLKFDVFLKPKSNLKNRS
jgi:hypothetical protein